MFQPAPPALTSQFCVLRRLHQCQQCGLYFPDALSFLAPVDSALQPVVKEEKDEGEVLRLCWFCRPSQKVQQPPVPPTEAVDASNEPRGPVQCDLCQNFFKSHKGLMQHKGKIHESEVKSVGCSTCTKQFKNKYALKMHQRQVHERATRVRCSLCGKEVYNKYSLKTHVCAPPTALEPHSNE